MTEQVISAQQRQAKWNADLERRKLATRALDYYNNQQREYIKARIEKLYSKDKDIITEYILTHPLTKTLIDDMAIVFTEPCDIRLSDETSTDKQREMLPVMLSDAHFNQSMISVDRMVELTHKVGVIPRWHPKGYIVLDILTPDRCYIEQDELDHTRAKAVYYNVGRLTNTPNGVPLNVYDKWTDDTYSQVTINSNGAVISEVDTMPNPYGKIPVVWFTNEQEIDEFWHDCGYPIVDANENVDLRLTNMSLALDYQAFSLLVTIGLPETQTIAVGVTQRVNIPASSLSGETPQGADAKYITPSPMLSDYWRIINEYIIQIARANGLSAQSVNRDNAGFASGYQLKLSKQDNINRNKLKRQFYLEPMRELIQLMMDCYTKNSTDTFKFPTQADIIIDFAEMTFDDNPMEREQINAMRLSNGTTSEVMILMEDNPDLTEQDAVEKLAKIREQRQRLGALPNNIDEALI